MGAQKKSSRTEALLKKTFFDTVLLDPTASTVDWINYMQHQNIDPQTLDIQTHPHFRIRASFEAFASALMDARYNEEMATAFPFQRWATIVQQSWNKEQHYFGEVHRLALFMHESGATPIQEEMYNHALTQRRWKHCIDAQSEKITALKKYQAYLAPQFEGNPAFDHMSEALDAYAESLEDGKTYFQSKEIARYLPHVHSPKPKLIKLPPEKAGIRADGSLLTELPEEEPFTLDENTVFWRIAGQALGQPTKHDIRIPWNGVDANIWARLHTTKGSLMNDQNLADAQDKMNLSALCPTSADDLMDTWSAIVTRMRVLLQAQLPAIPKSTDTTHALITQRRNFVTQMLDKLQQATEVQAWDYKQSSTKEAAQQAAGFRKKQSYDEVEESKLRIKHQSMVGWLSKAALFAHDWQQDISSSKHLNPEAKREMLSMLRDYCNFFEAARPLQNELAWAQYDAAKAHMQRKSAGREGRS